MRGNRFLGRKPLCPSLEAAFPSLGEIHGLDAGEDVDAIGLHADLQDHARRREVLHREVADRGPEGAQRGVDAGCILGRGIDPDVEVLGETRGNVLHGRVSANDQEVRISGGQRGEQIAKVGVVHGFPGKR